MYCITTTHYARQKITYVRVHRQTGLFIM